MSQRKITEIFAEKDRTFSFEFYPPKTDKGMSNLLNAAEELADLGADYFSVTYGAGGAGSKATLNVVRELLERFDVPVMHHLTCVKHTFETIRRELQEMKEAGVRNIMALRGDPPADDPDFEPGHNQPEYSYELVNIIREWGDWFAIGVAGFPEGHPLSPTLPLDSRYLKIKENHGADFCATQLFFENKTYFQFARRVRDAGVTMRLIPGILPITNYVRLLEFCMDCGASVPRSVRSEFGPLKDDREATREKGIEFAIRQCQELLDGGAPGIHFYCLNKTEPVRSIFKELRT
ncbi:MAG: methylenetetrahydrofolate reductase [Phycisphaerae bacterium]